MRLSAALEKLCEPILSEYIDDSTGLDLIGRRIVWQLGRIAWNIAVTGRRDLASEALHCTRLDANQQLMIQNETSGLVKRKYVEFPNFHTTIRDFSILLVNGVPRLKARPGDTFPAALSPALNEQKDMQEITPEFIFSLRKNMKLSQVRFGELVGVSSRKVSAWEHGNAVPTEGQKNMIGFIAQENT